MTYSGRDSSGTGNTGGRADRIGNGRLANPSWNNTFDTSAFAVPPCGPANPAYPSVTCTPIGRFGNSGRNIIYGPVFGNAYGRIEMAALMKTFPLYKEKLKFTFSMYVINPFNRSYLFPPNTNISDFQNVGKQTKYGGSGASLGGSGVGRTVNLGGRFEF